MKRQLWGSYQQGSISYPVLIKHAEEEVFAGTTRSVLDMPICIAGGSIQIPSDLIQYKSVIDTVVKAEQMYGDFHEHNIYLTVDTRPVAPGKSQRRPGAHLDSYVPHLGKNDTIAHTYIVCNCLPTEFFPAPLVIDHDLSCEDLLAGFDWIADSSVPVTYPPCALMFLTPWVLHRSATNSSDQVVPRTFVKITVTKQQHCLEGNTPNPLIPLDWPHLPRNPTVRNHPFKV
jgi:hypothetical protein